MLLVLWIFFLKKRREFEYKTLAKQYMRLFVMRWKWKMMWTKNWNFKATCFQLITMAHEAKKGTNWNIGYSLDFFKISFCMITSASVVSICAVNLSVRWFYFHIFFHQSAISPLIMISMCVQTISSKNPHFFHQNFWFRKYTKIKVKIWHAWMVLFSYLFLLSIVLICFRLCFNNISTHVQSYFFNYG